MRRLALFSTLVLLAALYAPIASAALADPMACCPSGGSAAMCCPLDGSCVWKSCHGEEQGFRLTSLTAFTLPSPAALPLPSDELSCLGRPEATTESGSPGLPDPPPRA